MKRSTKIQYLVAILLVGLPACGWLVSEIRWSRINAPTGRFTQVDEYVDHGRLPARVTKVQRDSKTFFIAYSPMDTWLAVPSGPAAYVFDESGQMVEWSPDTGDDRSFKKNWLLPQGESSLEELRQIGFQEEARNLRPAAPDPRTK